MNETSHSSRSELCARMEAALRARHYSALATKAYTSWICRFLKEYWFSKPDERGEREVTAFLTRLATEKRVSASTQNQALSAILFLFKQVLGHELPWMDRVLRARRSGHLTVVPSREEVHRILQQMWRERLASSPGFCTDRACV